MLFRSVSQSRYGNEDDWVKNKEAVQRICDMYGNHLDIQYAFDRLEMNK